MTTEELIARAEECLAADPLGSQALSLLAVARMLLSREERLRSMLSRYEADDCAVCRGNGKVWHSAWPNFESLCVACDGTGRARNAGPPEGRDVRPPEGGAVE